MSTHPQIDWIVGETTSENHVLPGDGGSAEVLKSDTAVFVGKNAGSNDNSLTIAGPMNASR